jgi:hypothetical protein
LYEHDLPSPTGFIMFAEPIAAWTQHGVTVEIVAASWGLVRPPFLTGHGAFDAHVGADWTGGAVWFTFYSDPLGAVSAIYGNEENYMREWRQQTGPLLPDNELIWRVGTLEDFPGDEHQTAAWGQTLCAAWLLMSQPLTATTRETAPRPARRRLHKARLPAGDVQVVRIRSRQPRPSGHQVTNQDTDQDMTGRQHDHRWWVTGHWRRYHCGPGRGRIERRWISPYLAGPDDKPIGGQPEHVKVWDR